MTGHIVPKAKSREAYHAFIQSVRSYVSREIRPDFVSLQKMRACPYVLRKDGTGLDPRSAVVKPIGNAAPLKEGDLHFPGDENTTTHLKTPQCWGIDGHTVLVTIHWVFECQGEGDKIALVRRHGG